MLSYLHGFHAGNHADVAQAHGADRDPRAARRQGQTRALHRDACGRRRLRSAECRRAEESRARRGHRPALVRDGCATGGRAAARARPQLQRPGPAAPLSGLALARAREPAARPITCICSSCTRPSSGRSRAHSAAIDASTCCARTAFAAASDSCRRRSAAALHVHRSVVRARRRASARSSMRWPRPTGASRPASSRSGIRSSSDAWPNVSSARSGPRSARRSPRYELCVARATGVRGLIGSGCSS